MQRNITKLSYKHTFLLILVYKKGFSYKQVALAMQISKAQIYLDLDKLKDRGYLDHDFKITERGKNVLKMLEKSINIEDAENTSIV